MTRLLATLAWTCVPLGQALAWGDEGHRVVCEIALREVAPATRDRVQALIATDGRFTSFSDACTWPDHPRQRAEEHSVNLARDTTHLARHDAPGQRPLPAGGRLRAGCCRTRGGPAAAAARDATARLE